MNFSSPNPIMTTMSINLGIPPVSSKYGNTYTNFQRQKIVWEQSKLPVYQQLAYDAISDALQHQHGTLLWVASTSLISSVKAPCDLCCNSFLFQKLRKPSSRSSQAQNLLEECWKPNCRADPTRGAYREGRASLQSLRRQEVKLSNIKDNNHFMQ